MSPRLNSRSAQPVDGGRQIPRNTEISGLWNLVAEDCNGAVFGPARSNKKITQHELGVIPGRRDLGDGGFAIGEQPGE